GLRKPLHHWSGCALPSLPVGTGATRRTAKRTSELVGGGAHPGGSGVSPENPAARLLLLLPALGAIRGFGWPPGACAALAGDEGSDAPQGYDEADHQVGDGAGQRRLRQGACAAAVGVGRTGPPGPGGGPPPEQRHE